jgi:hypothetical protein
VISRIAETVAALGDRCSFSIFEWTASTTTIASSTTIPIASTNANRVSRFIENPNSLDKRADYLVD